MCPACPVCDEPDASHPNNTHRAFSWCPSIGLWKALSCEQALSGCPDNTMGGERMEPGEEEGMDSEV